MRPLTIIALTTATIAAGIVVTFMLIDAISVSDMHISDGYSAPRRERDRLSDQQTTDDISSLLGAHRA